MAYADLEISLHRLDEGDAYELELRYTDSNLAGDLRLGGDGTKRATFDRRLLRQRQLDLAAYGKALTEGLFKDAEVEAFFRRACSYREALSCPLQLRLRLTRKVLHLHGLRWETILNPATGAPLATDQNVLFSRYIDSRFYRAPRPRRPGARPRVLVVIADPQDAGQYSVGGNEKPLARVDVAGDLARARAALAGCELEELTKPGAATLAELAYRAANCDVLYLACHGSLDGSEPRLWLVDAANQSHVVSGLDLAGRMNEWRAQPYVVVLASCQSAGGPRDEDARLDEFGTLAALGPRLAEAGVPAVLAMQGDVGMKTVSKFVPAFFETLVGTGQVDLATAVARRKAQDEDCPDYWMPVLFSRMRSGQVWAELGLHPAPQQQGGEEFERWEGLLTNLKAGECTPLLGPDLLEPLVGPREDIARLWAERFGYPLEAGAGDSLTRMAQSLAVNQNVAVPADQYLRYLREELLERRHGPAPAAGTPVKELLRDAALRRRQAAPDAFALLAGMPCRVYLSVNGDDLLEQALGAAGRTPQVAHFNWLPDAAGVPPAVALERAELSESPFHRQATLGRPPADRPLVYHLFGDLDTPESLVLTEDNLMDFLAAMTREAVRRERLPDVVPGVLPVSALLVLGFRLTDLDFHILLRSLQPFLVARRRNRYTSVAVQIDPRREQVGDVGAARRFLENFMRGVEIDIFWGGAEEFLRKLRERLGAR
jgi:hypothetical protein